MTRDRIVAALLIVIGAVGFFGSAELVIERVLQAGDANAQLNCDFSLIVQCGKNLGSWQGSVFGFPNPILGLGGFVAPIAVGVGTLAGAHYARWFWIAFNTGMLGAVAFVGWLIAQSIFSLGTLCPWCMLVWSVTIPGFLITTFRNLAAGIYGTRAEPAGRHLLAWTAPITVIVFGTIALIAQLRLDVLGHLT
ncbi:MAG: vitamin K epoxide reductase family protein [Pseudolysinimonas sp.]